MKFNLDRIESRLQTFIENSLVFSRRNNLLARKLVTAMQNNLEISSDGSAIAPSHYTLSLNPQILVQWQSNPELLDRLAEVLNNAAREGGVSFLAPLTIRLTGDPAIAPDDLSVATTEYSGSGSTAAMPVIGEQDRLTSPDSFPPGAFLIVNGLETVPLRQGVVNIGRRLDNHVIINDARVSRSHAQLRAIRGRYVLFDLNSSGGTFVNGIRISQQALRPGDVISLSGVPLIYSEETPLGDSDTTTYHPNRK